MKKSSIRSREVRTPDPFGGATYKTERTGVAVLMHWMRQIIEDKHLDLGLPDVETGGEDRKMPDLVIYESRRSQRVLCVVEAKPPYYVNVLDEENLKDPARSKANKRKAPYFATTNFKQLVWFSTERANDSKRPEEEQIIAKYSLSEIENLECIEQTRYSEPIKRELERFLTQLIAVHTGEEVEPRLPVDEFLIWRLQNKIGTLSGYYKRAIQDRFHKDPRFAKALVSWFVDQGWSFAAQDQDFDKAAHQTAYLLVNKILFYDLLQARRPHDLDPLGVPEGLTKGSVLQKNLQNYFDEVLRIDYETIYTTDFIDTIAFPDDKEVVGEIKELIRVLRKYDFSRLGYDIIGRIFERLIPARERHNLGQYFTNPDVVDIILRFCLRHEDDKVLDPACGAGTFLVRAYQHKKIMNQRLEHERALATLWGVDIAKFPAHLATINLAINDLSVDRNYPNILHEDFFALQVDESGFANEAWRKRRAKTLGLEEREVTYPRWFDAIVGNPPYTRQEEIPEIGVDKEKLIEAALTVGETQIATLSKRAGIHAYFFVHGTKFLRDGGMFGLVVSNSWMDVDYGKGLQEFFLNNYKIIAIIESKVERWFEDADVNTCIVILQKCKDKSERDENLVRFVYLKKPLRYFIPAAQDIWDAQVARLHAIDGLKRTVLAHNDIYENDDLRIYPITQRELWDEGFDAEKQRYVGAKWGKYLRAPDIFFTILRKGKGKLVPLKEVADIRRGFTTGANKFFYLTEEEIARRGIEREFWMHQDDRGNWIPNYVIKSPRECKSIVVNPRDLKFRVLMVHKDREELRGTNVLRYIEEGERKGFHLRPTCASRGERWYDLGSREFGTGFWIYVINDRYVTFHSQVNVYVDCELFEIYVMENAAVPILACLNSSLTPLLSEIGGRTVLGQGALKTQVYEVERLLITSPALFHAASSKQIETAFGDLSARAIGTVFDEIGASSPEEVSLDKVKPDRRALDQILMGDILGLTEEEQLEVYRAVVDLVRSRIERAKTFDKRKKTGGIDVESLKQTIIDRIAAEEEE